MKKKCSNCGVEKGAEGFYTDRSHNDNLSSACRKCSLAKTKDRRATDRVFRERCIRIAKEWRSANPEKYKKSVRNARLKKQYGIIDSDYREILKNQGGGCAICGRKENGTTWGAYLHIDHDHISNKVRGILCHACNTTLGKMNDDPALLRRAAEYLEKSK